MTADEYARAYIRARRQWPTLIAKAMREIKNAYITACEQVAKEIEAAELSGKSELTIQSMTAIENELAKGAAAISAQIEAQTLSTVQDSLLPYSLVEENYLVTAVRDAGATGHITEVGIKNLFVAVNDGAMRALHSKIWQDGYSFSQRVWQTGKEYETMVKRLLSSGLAQGRPAQKIARDLGDYLKGGIGKLPGGYTQAKYGRIVVKNIDYRALRLVRTEMTDSVRIAQAQNGRFNPASTGLYDWVRLNNQQHDCACPEYAANSPYTFATLPSTPHPHCHPAGTLIATEFGERPIESISVGDYVYSHLGKLQLVTHTWESKYDGDMIKFESSRRRLLATLDHPVLLNGNWVSAQFIEDGDCLSCIEINGKSGSLIEDESNRFPPDRVEIGGFFTVIKLLSRTGVPVAAIYLDGQLFIEECEINVESENGEIRNGFFSKPAEFIEKQLLIGRIDLSGDRLSYGASVFVRHEFSLDGHMSWPYISDSSIGVGTSMSLRNVWKFETKQNKVSVDAQSGNTKDLSYLIDRKISILKEIDDYVPRKVNFTHDRHSVSVSRKRFNGPVYNLTVSGDHSFIANGFASHNCMCMIRPRLRNRTDFVNDLKDFAKGNGPAYLTTWYHDVYLKNS